MLWPAKIKSSCCRILYTSVCGFVFSPVLVFPYSAQAAEPAVSRAALVNLAQQFVESVDYGFGQADEYLDKIQGRENFKAIPDGEILLLQVGVGGRQGLKFPQPVVAIKQGDDVLISLFDFVSVAQFAIDVKPPEKIAEGWYIRENKKFLLDGNTMKVTADGRTYDLAEGDVEFDDADILVRSDVLAKVFEFQGGISLRYQRLDVSSAQKWPAIEKLERLRRRKREPLPPPSLPRQDEPYQMASVPNIDITTSYDFSKEGHGGETAHTRSHSAVISGDMAKHTLRAVASGDDMYALQNLSATMKRESEEPELLGRMKARKYEFGDVSGVNVPGAISNRSGVGMRLTNRNPYETSDVITEIEGDVAPGWDVELYRGSEYIDVITSADGRYIFENVFLSGGENKFRIVKYGPLGEVEEEEFVIYSTPKELAEVRDLYDVSVNASDTVLWTRKSSDDDDKYSPIIAGTLEHQVTRDTSIKGGLSTSQQDEQQKTYLHGGVATYIEGTILNAGVTTDVDGAFTANTTARRAILGHHFSVGAGFTGDNYGVTGDDSTPSEYSLDFTARGALPTVFDYSLGNYTFTTTYTEDADDVSQQTDRLALANRIGELSFNNNFTRETRKGPDAESERLSGRSSVSGSLWGARWRASTEYQIDPEWHVDNYQMDVTRRLAKDLQGRAVISNEPDTDFTEGIASLIWDNEHITLSPGVSYNSDNDFSAFVTANFGLVFDSHSHDIVMSGDKISDRGAVSAFVYLDKNGDSIFSEGDEPIQDALVEALHSNRKGSTDEGGEAFIHDLPYDVITDVKLNEFSLFDPFMVAGTRGVSIRPRPGHDARIEFPVHNGGELDGTVYVRMNDGKERSARNVKIHLHDIAGNLVQSMPVSFDGFYLFQKIHPGQYWLMVDSKDARNNGLIRPLPEKITFGYEGTLKYGHQIFLRKAVEDEVDVPSSIGEDYAEYISLNPGVNVNAVRDNEIVLNFGEYRSRAMMGVIWYKLKMLYGSAIGGAELLLPISQSNPSVKTGLHSLRAIIPGLTMQDAYARCHALVARGLECKVEMLPSGLDQTIAESKQASL